MDLEQLKKDTKEILVDVLAKSRLRQGQILVLGMSSSEVAGGQIGKASNIDIAEAIVQTLLDELNPRGIYLAVQGCEHLNRALVVERELADKKESRNCQCPSKSPCRGSWTTRCFQVF